MNYRPLIAMYPSRELTSYSPIGMKPHRPKLPFEWGYLTLQTKKANSLPLKKTMLRIFTWILSSKKRLFSARNSLVRFPAKFPWRIPMVLHTELRRDRYHHTQLSMWRATTNGPSGPNDATRPAPGVKSSNSSLLFVEKEIFKRSLKSASSYMFSRILFIYIYIHIYIYLYSYTINIPLGINYMKELWRIRIQKSYSSTFGSGKTRSPKTGIGSASAWKIPGKFDQPQLKMARWGFPTWRVLSSGVIKISL